MVRVVREWTRGEHTISTDPSRLDLDVVHGFLARSYWAAGIPRDVVELSVANSLSFGLYDRTAQVGFARLVTDYATFAQLMDVFVLEPSRGRGLGVWLVEVIVTLPELQGLRRWGLNTRDAHELYRRFGFREPAEPAIFMERIDPDAYKRR